MSRIYEIKITNQDKFDKKYSECKELSLGIEEKRISSVGVDRFKTFDFFDIPGHLENKKIETLIHEINSLPSGAFEKYPNLLAHQLRTLLALILIYWLESESIVVEEKNRDLKKLIKFAISKKYNFKENSKRKVIEILGDFESKGLKELADDIIHCDYSLAKPELVGPFANYIKNILSKIFGR
jgi:hypothetical protein